MLSVLKIVSLSVTVMSSAMYAAAESHAITFTNNCGYGTPVVSQNFATLANGDYTANGPFSAAIMYLDTGCGFQGTNCAIVETTLVDGAVSSTDISLIPDHAFNVPTAFVYTGACTDQSASCTSASCPSNEAFHVTTDYGAQRQCTASDVGLHITFC